MWLFCISDNAGGIITMLLWFFRVLRSQIMNKDILPQFLYANIIYYLLGQSRVDKSLLQPIGHFKFIERRDGILKTKKKKNCKNLLIFRYLKDLLHISLKIPPKGMPQMGGKSIHTKYIFYIFWFPMTSRLQITKKVTCYNFHRQSP